MNSSASCRPSCSQAAFVRRRLEIFAFDWRCMSEPCDGISVIMSKVPRQVRPSQIFWSTLSNIAIAHKTETLGKFSKTRLNFFIGHLSNDACKGKSIIHTFCQRNKKPKTAYAKMKFLHNTLAIHFSVLIFFLTHRSILSRKTNMA